MKRMSEMNTADRRMSRTLIFFLAGTIALVALWAAVVGTKVGFGVMKGRTNPQQEGTPRVYDYADMLSDEQEEALEKKIASAEKGISADIVIVILNESLEEKYPDLIYMRSDETDAYKGIQRYAESFWVDQGFGWNEAGNTGNGIIMVDNIYRESNGWVYNWVAGAGDLRFSVGDDNCEELSQSFTDRLPYGDMPRYNQVYADALMAFVDDCSTFGQKLRGMLGWRLFTPNVMFATIGSSIIATVAVFILLSVIFGRMLWHMHYNGKQKEGAEGKKKKRFSSGFGGTFMIAAFIIIASINAYLGFAAVVIGLISVYVRSAVEEKKSEKKGDDNKEEPFARKIMLAPNMYKITNQQDTLVRRYSTSYTESSGGGGGGGFSGGGGGGFSGGGGGGGGFSGGGSHR